MNSILAGNIYIPCNNEYVCPKITYLNYEGISGYTTYQLSLISMANSNVKNIYAFVKKDNPKVKKVFLKKKSNLDMPINSSINISKLKKILKKK